jgi:hypothetical protein
MYAELQYRLGFAYAQSDGLYTDSGLYYLQEAEKKIDLFPPYEKKDVYHALGNYFGTKGEHRIALPYLFRALELAEGYEGAFHSMIIRNITSSYISLHELDSAKYYMDLYKSVISKDNDRENASYYSLESYFLEMKGDSCSPEVLNSLLKSVHYSMRQNSISSCKRSLFLISDRLTRGNKTEKIKVPIAQEALVYFDSLYVPVKQSSDPKVFSEFLVQYARLESLYGDPVKANKLNAELVPVLTQMLKSDYMKGIDEALVKYKSELKDTEIAYGKKVNTFLIAGVVFLFLVGLYIAINFQRINILNRKITDQKKELEQLNNVKDRLFSVISHDMRTPVNSLISFTQLLEENAIPPDKLAAYSVSLRNSLGYTAGLMDNLLNWPAARCTATNPLWKTSTLQKLLQE